jgi:hypothetical protein
MKLIVFKEKGEVRCPTKGEWVVDYQGNYLLVCEDDRCIHRPIYERIEIEVPEGADRLHYCWYKGRCSDGIILKCGDIDFPRPKVKRWRWQCEVRPSIKWKTTEHHTEEEIKTAYSIGTSCSMFTKVEGSEVEVEE